jgi:hypothetical protein
MPWRDITQNAPLGQKGDGNAYTLYSRGKLFSSSNYSRYFAYMGKMGMCGAISCSLLE